jgi:hypothetical protein
VKVLWHWVVLVALVVVVATVLLFLVTGVGFGASGLAGSVEMAARSLRKGGGRNLRADALRTLRRCCEPASPGS